MNRKLSAGSAKKKAGQNSKKRADRGGARMGRNGQNGHGPNNNGKSGAPALVPMVLPDWLKSATAAGSNSTVEAQSPAILPSEVAALPIEDQIAWAIETARAFAFGKLSKTGLTNGDPQAAADAFLVSADKRLRLVLPGSAHALYRDDLHDVRHRLGELDKIRWRGTQRLRLDHLLEALVDEARLLSESQTTMCQSCEHCRRENPHLIDEELAEKDPLSDRQADHLVRLFEEDFSGLVEERHIILILRHLDALATNGRPVAVSQFVARLITALVPKEQILERAASELAVSAGDGLEDEIERFAGYARDAAAYEAVEAIERRRA